MGFLKSLLSLFGKSEPEEAPTVRRPMPPDDDDDEDADRTTVMSNRQFRDVTERTKDRSGGKQ